MIRRLSRRAFVCSVSALAVSAATAAGSNQVLAQQTTARKRVGVLLVLSSPESKDAQQFRHGLLEAGYTEGRDVTIEWRSANGDYSQVPKLAADLVRSKVDAIVVETTPAAHAVKQATSTIPIVIAIASDPVGAGLVTSLAHPGENIIGLSLMGGELHIKRLQLLKETILSLSRVAVLWNPDARWQAKQIEQLNAVAPSLAIELTVVGARTPEEFSGSLSVSTRSHAQGLLVIGGSPFWNHRATLAKLALNARLPAIYYAREFAEAGGLMSYGANYGDLFLRSAGYVDKILKGAKPGDLPIEQPTKFELVINLKTARSMSLNIPQAVLERADEIIK